MAVDDIDFITSFCPKCAFVLGDFVPGIPCPMCGEIIL